MQLHLVGGFLGSGKTTAIIGAARLLAAQGQTVGVVTNDQGKYLVDTAFFHAAGVPAVEVTGGCFCCHYDDLTARLEQLRGTARPDAIFAESVGSCADLVATVMKPLLELQTAFAPASFSVFADCRLLRRRLLDEPMPFSEDVVYVFDQQIEEAGLLVVNKVDLLAQPALDELRELVRRRWPEKPVLLHSALQTGGAAEWLRAIEGAGGPALNSLAGIDYPRYGAGEARLAWLDMRLALAVQPGEGQKALTRLLEGIWMGLAARGAGLGHLKMALRWEGGEAKLSLTALEGPAWRERVPSMGGDQVAVLLNARAELPPGDLLELVKQSLGGCGAAFSIQRVESFAPGFPNPTHRLG